MKKEILQLVNEFLAEKNKPQVTATDTLYSSGLLDSFDMFELILFLEHKGRMVKVPTEGVNFILDAIDSTEKITNLCS